MSNKIKVIMPSIILFVLSCILVFLDTDLFALGFVAEFFWFVLVIAHLLIIVYYFILEIVCIYKKVQHDKRKEFFSAYYVVMPILMLYYSVPSLFIFAILTRGDYWN